MPSQKTPIELIDSHCHFDFAVFDDEREQIWQDCKDQGVTTLLIPGVYPEQWAVSQSICKRMRGIYYAAGIHPWWIKTRKLELQGDWREFAGKEMAIHLESKNCVAVGECGLDKVIDTDFELQKDVFLWHLQQAEALNLPVIIHCRKAHNEILQMLKPFPRLKGVVHAFSGSIELAEQYWSRGFRIGVGGTITYARAQKTRQTVRQVPLEWVLLETDAPDMPISGEQGKPNTPLRLNQIAQCLAALRVGSDSLEEFEQTLEEVARHTSNNFKALFVPA
ncbi:putative metal-dependent hydrolase YjjV [Thalassocella blandensis]|nr:putative metal-dependent hydrolase YjjV [Thalassocella blandensis]